MSDRADGPDRTKGVTEPSWARTPRTGPRPGATSPTSSRHAAQRVLDVGCNDGTFGAGVLARRPGREVWGIEPHDLDAETASRRLTGVVNGFYPEALERYRGRSTASASTTCSSTWWTLGGAARTRERLAPGGCIVGELPNVRHLPFLVDLTFRGRFDYVDSGLLDRTHLRFFTRSSAHDLFTSRGFEVDAFFPVVAMGNARLPADVEGGREADRRPLLPGLRLPGASGLRGGVASVPERRRGSVPARRRTLVAPSPARSPVAARRESSGATGAKSVTRTRCRRARTTAPIGPPRMAGTVATYEPDKVAPLVEVAELACHDEGQLATTRQRTGAPAGARAGPGATTATRPASRARNQKSLSTPSITNDSSNPPTRSNV